MFVSTAKHEHDGLGMPTVSFSQPANQLAMNHAARLAINSRANCRITQLVFSTGAARLRSRLPGFIWLRRALGWRAFIHAAAARPCHRLPLARIVLRADAAPQSLACLLPRGVDHVHPHSVHPATLEADGGPSQ